MRLAGTGSLNPRLHLFPPRAPGFRLQALMLLSRAEMEVAGHTEVGVPYRPGLFETDDLGLHLVQVALPDLPVRGPLRGGARLESSHRGAWILPRGALPGVFVITAPALLDTTSA
jgi:hypothetical protein